MNTKPTEEATKGKDSYFFCSITKPEGRQTRVSGQKYDHLLFSTHATRLFMKFSRSVAWKDLKNSNIKKGEAHVPTLSEMTKQQRTDALSLLVRIGYIKIIRKGLKNKPALVKITNEAPIELGEKHPEKTKWFRVHRNEILDHLIEKQAKAFHLLVYIWVIRVFKEEKSWAVFSTSNVPGMTRKEVRIALNYLHKNHFIRNVNDRKTALRIFPMLHTKHFKLKTCVTICTEALCDRTIFSIRGEQGPSDMVKGPKDIDLIKNKPYPSKSPQEGLGFSFDSGKEEIESPNQESRLTDEEVLTNLPALDAALPKLRRAVAEIYRLRIEFGYTDKLNWRQEDWRWANWHTRGADQRIADLFADDLIPKGTWKINWPAIQICADAHLKLEAMESHPDYPFRKALMQVGDNLAYLPKPDVEWMCDPKNLYGRYARDRKVMVGDLHMCLYNCAQAYMSNATLKEHYFHIARDQDFWSEDIERALLMYVDDYKNTDDLIVEIRREYLGYSDQLSRFREVLEESKN